MNRTTFKVSFYLKKQTLKKSGKMPIIARIIINKEVAQFSTKLEVEEDSWNVSSGRARGTNSDSKSLNCYLDQIQSSIVDIYQNERYKGNLVTARKIKMLYFGEDETQLTLLSMFEKHNNDIKSLVGKGTTLPTYKKYELAKRRIEEFMKFKYNISDISPKELNLYFIRDYELFLRVQCNLSNNVAAKMIMYLKKIVTLAFNNGVIKSNPFATFHIKREKKDRGFLSYEELETIMAKKIDIQRLDALRDIFLFCCFTGLSYIDVKQLKKCNITKSSDGKFWVNTQRQKTKSKVSVMLLDIPVAILNKYANSLDKDQVLPMLSNQKCNSYLKELSDICGIDKNLTFHMSRHTFATTITLLNGVPIESVSKMLGHSSIKTTQIYAKITNEKISKDMKMVSGKIENLMNAYRG